MPKNVKCKNCLNLKRSHWCERVLDSPDEDMIRDCRHFCQKTNADCIRAMTDEELAKFIIVNTPYRPLSEPGKNYFGASGKGYFEPHEAMKDWVDWLQQPAKEE